MPAMNHTAYPEKVADGSKTCSIRNKRKRGEFRVGKPIYHFSGMRTKQCKRILDSVCTEVKEIDITYWKDTGAYVVFIGGYSLSHEDAEKLAKNDGFESVQAFVDYFTLGKRKRLRKDFKGNLIRWKHIRDLWK